MATIERILQTDSGKVAFEKTDRNMMAVGGEITVLSENTKDVGIYNTPINVGGGYNLASLRANRNSFTIGYNPLNPPVGWGDGTVFGLESFSKLDFINRENTDELLFRSRNSDGSNRSWKQIATTEKTEILLLNGWTHLQQGFKNLSCAKVGNIVTITGVLSVGTKTAGTKIAQLPPGFRPLSAYISEGFCETSAGVNTSTRFDVWADGYIVITVANVPSFSNWVSFNINMEV